MIRIVSLMVCVLFFVACQKQEAPVELVRIVPGKSLVEQVAPAMKRNKGSKTKIVLIQDSLSEEKNTSQIIKWNQKDTKQHEPLYISGQKAKNKKTIQEKSQKKSFESQAGQ